MQGHKWLVAPSTLPRIAGGEGEGAIAPLPAGSDGTVGCLIVGCRCPDGTIKHHLYSKKCQGVKKQRETSRQPVVSPFSNFASFLSKEP